MINVVDRDGEPMNPLNCRRKLINQCGVLVRDMVPITFEEWQKPKDVNKPTTYVDDRTKELLWDKILTKVTLPPEVEEDEPWKLKFKHWTLIKMGEQFRTWKKNLWKLYKDANEQDPEWEGALVKIKDQWPTFVKQRKSDAAVARSAKNKLNAGKKEYHHTLGAGGYLAAVPKWEAFEARLLDNGIIPQTHDWPERSKFWLFAHGAGLDPETVLIVAQGKWKKKVEYITKELVNAIDLVRKGLYVVNREKDELSLALGNPEKVGRVRGYGPRINWGKGWPEDAPNYRSRQRKKKEESDRLSALERKVQLQQERLDSFSNQRQVECPEVEAAPSEQRKSSVGSTHVEHSEVEPSTAHYPVDDITEKTECELHMAMKNMSIKVAVGYALPNQPGASYHLGGIPSGYARVGVDDFVPLYADLNLDIPGGDDEKTLGEAKKAIILWKKEHIVIPNPPPRPPTPPSRSPAAQDAPSATEDAPSTAQDLAPPAAQDAPSPPQAPSPPPQDPSSPPQDAGREPSASPSPAMSRPSIVPTTKSFSLKRKLSFTSTRSDDKLSREERELLKPLPKRAYDLTEEELDEEVRSEVKRQLGPKQPPPKETIPPEKVKKFLKNISSGKAQEPKLPDDYERTIRKVHRYEQQGKQAAYLQKRKQMLAEASEQQKQKEAAFRLKREQLRAAASGKQVAQLGEQPQKSITPLKVISDKEVQPRKEYEYAWTYVYGQPLVRPEEVDSLPTQMRRLNHWYLKATEAKKENFWVKTGTEHYFVDDAMFVEFSELFQLFNQDALDKALVSCYCL